MLSKTTWTYYLYRIDFVDGDFYYGLKKRIADDPLTDGYWGSPKTHRHKWSTTMYSKSIVAYLWTDRKGASEAEDDVIRANGWNTPQCLNDCLGGGISTVGCQIAGKKGGGISRDKKLGYCDPKIQSKAGKIGGHIAMPIINANKTSEQRTAEAKLAHRRRKAKNPEKYRREQQNAASHGGAKKFYICTKTGHLSNATGMGQYHKKMGIDRTNKILLSPEEDAFIFVWGHPAHWRK